MGEKGFTLIELMLVGCILGILIAVAIPRFSKYKTSDDAPTVNHISSNVIKNN